MTHTLHTLLKEIKATYGDWAGPNPGLQSILLYQLLKQGSGAPVGSTTPAGSIASSVTIRGSTGQTVLTDSTGAIVVSKAATEDTLQSLLNRIPQLINGRIPVTTDGAKETTLTSLLQRIPQLANNRLPVGVEFPSNQQVTVSNLPQNYATQTTLESVLERLTQLLNKPAAVTPTITGFSTEQTLESLLNRTPQLSNGRVPVGVEFPSIQHVLVDNPITDHATEATLGALLSRTPLLSNGKVPVVATFPEVQRVTVENQVGNGAKETTLSTLLARIPELISSRYPVNVENQITGYSTEATLSALLAKAPTLVEGKVPVVATFPDVQKVAVSNPTTDHAKDTTLGAVLNKLPTLNNGKVPTLVDFPTTQRVSVDNPLVGFATEVTLGSILGKLPTLNNGKTPVQVDFPTSQRVTVDNPITGYASESTLGSILNKLPSLSNGKTPVLVDFPTTQRVVVDNPSDVSLLGREATLGAILARIPSDISRAIATGFRSEFTNTNPLATTLPAPSLPGTPLWSIARTKQSQGLDAFTITFLGRRATTFNSNGFTDLAEFDLQAVGNNLRSPTLNGTQTLEIVSSNAGDSATGTGVRTVEVLYLDENFALKNTVVTLTGVAATPILNGTVAIKPTCILELQANSYGSAQGAVGNIDVRIPTGGLLTSPQTVDRISVGDTTSLTARCCVPDGYLGYVVDVSGTAITANHEFRLMATVAQSDKRLLDGVFNTIDLFSVNAGTIPVTRNLAYLELPSRCRIRLASRASANSASATGGFTVVFVKKPV